MGERSALGKYAAIAASNLALLVTLTIGLELAFGNWFEAFVPPQMAVVNRSYKYRQYLYDPNGDVLYRRDKHGLRGSHETVSEIELVTVGGSTTDQRYITEGQTWQDVLRTLTGVRVANAGVDGMTSFGHLLAVSEWLHEIPNFSPKSYLHYVGVNDAELSQEPGQHDFDRSGRLSLSLRSLSARSAIVGAVEKLWFRSTGPRAVTHGAVTPRPNATFVKVDIDLGTIEPFIESVYKPNLRKLIELHRRRNERVIFVSQIAHPSLIQWKDGETFVAADSGNLKNFAAALGLINIATGRICRESADLCRFYDLATKVRFEDRDFYDLVHTTPSGAQKIGAFLAEEACSDAPARDDVRRTLSHCLP
jgi:hypothetical protein